MDTPPVYLAVDLGATSGRVIAGAVHDGVLKLKEVHRFPTLGVRLNSGYHWDVLGLYSSVLEGLRRAAQEYGERIAGIGVDTWGVDYALLDRHGRLLGNPHQYRDSRTDGLIEAVQETISAETIYAETGSQFLAFNSIYQLRAEQVKEPARLEAAADLLFLPDLFAYWLCGAKVQERTIASTTQLWNPQREAWSDSLLEALGLPKRLFRPVTEPGTEIGTLLGHVQEETGLGAVPVLAVAGHDTGSAVAGAPLVADNPAFLSSGTWSIMGCELPRPIVNEAARAGGFSNEAGVEGTTRFLKNICGMWLIEQLREQWSKEGHDYSYDNLLDMAREARPFLSLIDPDDARFARPGRMADRLCDYCRETGQAVPETKGELVRLAFESLACKYRLVFDTLEKLAGRTFPALRIVGGGSQNAFLNQCTASALGKPVLAGPVEATSLGNLLLQMKARGAIADLAEGRRLVENSFATREFHPEDTAAWREPVQRLQQLITP
ncbi:MAG: rhamnulokinase [Opitutales bacterium]